MGAASPPMCHVISLESLRIPSALAPCPTLPPIPLPACSRAPRRLWFVTRARCGRGGTALSVDASADVVTDEVRASTLGGAPCLRSHPTDDTLLRRGGGNGSTSRRPRARPVAGRWACRSPPPSPLPTAPKDCDTVPSRRRRPLNAAPIPRCCIPTPASCALPASAAAAAY